MKSEVMQRGRTFSHSIYILLNAFRKSIKSGSGKVEKWKKPLDIRSRLFEIDEELN